MRLRECCIPQQLQNNVKMLDCWNCSGNINTSTTQTSENKMKLVDMHKNGTVITYSQDRFSAMYALSYKSALVTTFIALSNVKF